MFVAVGEVVKTESDLWRLLYSHRSACVQVNFRQTVVTSTGHGLDSRTHEDSNSPQDRCPERQADFSEDLKPLGATTCANASQADRPLSDPSLSSSPQE
jgi:hypothetical protein